jgi:small-conductance mechanosensitive channel
MLAGCVALLRRGSGGRQAVEQRGWSVVLFGGYCSAAALILSTIANVVGNVSFADILASGTIFTAYYAVTCYVLYSVLASLTYALSASTVGQRSRALRVNRETVNRTVIGYLRAANWILWVLTALWAFHVSTQAVQQMRAIVRHEWKLGVVSISPLDALLFVLVLYVSTVVAKFIRFFLTEEIFPRTSMDSGAAQAGSRLVHIALIVVGIFLAFGAAGIELSKLTVMTGAFGVGLGFGLQNVVSNFVCGIIVSLERPVQIGNIIDVGDLSGEVCAIGFRASTVRTFDGAEVIVPNSELVTKSVVNWSLTNHDRRSEIKIGVAYGTDPERVLSILTRIVTDRPDVKRVPAPLITFDDFGESALNFTIRFWSKLDNRLQIRSELNVQITREFEREGIQIPFPQRDIHLHADAVTSRILLPMENHLQEPVETS